MLHVSNEYRNMGIGKELFRICVEKAKAAGAKKIYISAHFSEETQSFYKKIGCVDAIYISKGISEYHPGDDRQLEFVIETPNGSSPPSRPSNPYKIEREHGQMV
jgi:ribosomal protein S18 acetylase RimI-like enzyme